MDSFIIVTGNGQSIKVKARSNGTVSENALRRAFQLEQDVPIGLFRSDMALDGSPAGDDFVFELESEWRGEKFSLRWQESRRSRPATPTPMDSNKADRIQKVIDHWEDRVFMVHGEGGIQGSGVLISGRNILTAAHLSFKINESYLVRGTHDRCFSAKCEYICLNNDFAILNSTELPEHGTPADPIGRGSGYIIMGYPSGTSILRPSVTQGVIEGMMDDNIHTIGTPGSKRGYSGAPVLSYFGFLTGILLGSTSGISMDTTIRECLVSSAEQKYSRILGINVINNRYNEGRSDYQS